MICIIIGYIVTGIGFILISKEKPYWFMEYGKDVLAKHDFISDLITIIVWPLPVCMVTTHFMFSGISNGFDACVSIINKKFYQSG